MPDRFLKLTIPRDLSDLIDRCDHESSHFFSKDTLRFFGARPLHFYCIDTKSDAKIDPSCDEPQLIGYYVETRKDPLYGRIGTVRPVNIVISTRESDGERFAKIDFGSPIDAGLLKASKDAHKLAVRLRDEEREHRGLK